MLLDTHAILHRGYHAMPDFVSAKGEPTGALYGLASMVMRTVAELKPDYIIAAYDLPDKTHRHLAFEGYKGHRAETDEALVAQIIRAPDILKAFSIPLYSLAGFEADDVIGTIAHELKGEKDLEVIISSGDMDTMQLVDGKRVRVYTLKKGMSDTALFDEAAVKEKYGFGPEHIADFKGLRGDPSDNIPGVKGIGEKTACILVQNFGSVENMYKVLKKNPEKLKEAGVKDGMIEKLREQEEQALFSKQLATITLDVPINFTLPSRVWIQEVSGRAVLDMMGELGFRSLVPKIRELIGSGEGISSSDDTASPGLRSAGGGYEEGDEFAEAFPTETISDDDFSRGAVGVWLLNSTITNPTLDDIYQVGGSRVFEEAIKSIEAQIKENNLEFVYRTIELPLTPVLRAMEKRGVTIDTDFLAKLSKTYRVELERYAKDIYEAAGSTFNINSPKQLGEVLFDTLGLGVKNQKKTAGGARSTKESELEKLREQHPIIEMILRYRELQKLLSTYIDSIPTLVDETGRLHSSFVQWGTVTGRVASINPNLQNIPIKTELGKAIRNAFVASAGMSMLAFDYSQIELRIAAFLSGDEGLIEIFRTGRDVHREVAARIFRVQDSDVTHEQRRRAKTINFGILYGMGVNALREGLGTTRLEAQEFLNEYFAVFPRLALYLDEVKAKAAREGFISTFFGRRRYFEGIGSSIPFVRASAERMAINAPMQGTQADIVKLAMAGIYEWLQKEGYSDAHLLLQVHDELVLELPTQDVEKCAAKIKEIMEGVMTLEDTKGIPLIAEGKVGSNWGEMTKLEL